MENSGQTIKLKAFLSAYTKGVLPTKVSQLENDLNYVTDVESQDPKQYFIRQKDTWVDITEALDIIRLSENSGLIVETIDNKVFLSIDQMVIDKNEFDTLDILDTNKTYYVYSTDVTQVLNGGTAYSDGENDIVDETEYGIYYSGGNANTNTVDIIFEATNSRGYSNGK